MDLTTYAQLPVPEDDEADLVPYWLSLLGEKLDTSTVLQATSAYDRDVRYGAGPRGLLVVCNTGSTVNAVWIKTGGVGDPTWAVIWEPMPSAQAWFPPASISAGWRDLHTTEPGVSPFCFQWSKATDTVLIRGALWKDDPWTHGEIVAYVPTDMIPVYASGWSGSTFASRAAVASGEIRDATGEMRLWVWAIDQDEPDVTPNGAVWFDSVSYRKGDLT
ncbi:hypothetical protein ACIBSV_46700 [Embleya sp. NPDC050154]|uniref:hypothetical protein n=1 Tax=Embleya sp. NPDC050154 TaxID=3363988 RepID=UPI0037A3D993